MADIIEAKVPPTIDFEWYCSKCNTGSRVTVPETVTLWDLLIAIKQNHWRLSENCKQVASMFRLKIPDGAIRRV